MRPYILLFLFFTGSAVMAGSELDASDAVRRNPTGSLTLRETLRLALAQNPELAAFNSEIRAADARILQARLLPNPELEGEVENIAGTGEFEGTDAAEGTLQLSQLIELGGKRAKRTHVALLGRKLANSDYEEQKWSVLTETAQAFVETLAAQHRVELVGENLQLTRDALPAIERRVEAGRASEAEQTRTQLAISSVRIELEQARRDLGTARQVLAAQWGAATPQFAQVTGDFDHIDPPPPPSADLLPLIRKNPKLSRFEIELEQRRAQIDLERAQSVPDLTLAAGYRRFSATEENAAVIGFSLPLPFWNRNQGNIREAQAKFEKTQRLLTATTVDMSMQLGRAYERLRAAQYEIDLLTEEILPAAEKTYSGIDKGYEAGRFTLLDVLDARRVLTTSRLQLLEARKTYHQSVAEIEGLISKHPNLHLHE